MISLDNQDGSRIRRWAEGLLLASGALSFAVMGALRFVYGYVPSYPLSLVWLGGAALIGAGVALLYWRTARQPTIVEDAHTS